MIEVFKQFAIPLVHAIDPDRRSGRCFPQLPLAELAPLGRALVYLVPVGASSARPQFLDQLLLQIRRNGVLQALRLFVHFIPFHSQDLMKEPLNQMMAKSQPVRNLPAFVRQSDSSLAVHMCQLVPPQAPESQRYRRRRNVQPACNRRCDRGAVFRLRFRDGL